MNRLSLLLILIMSAASVGATVFRHGEPVRVAVSDTEPIHVGTAVGILEKDFRSVLSSPVERSADKADVIIGTLGNGGIIESLGLDFGDLKGRREGFVLESLPTDA